MAEIAQLEKIMRLIDEASMNHRWFIMQTLEHEMGVRVQTAKDKVQ